MKVLDGSHERAMLAWANSWISDRLDRMSKQGGSPNYEYGGSCGSAKGAQQLNFIYGDAAVRRHVRLGRMILITKPFFFTDLSFLVHDFLGFFFIYQFQCFYTENLIRVCL